MSCFAGAHVSIGRVVGGSAGVSHGGGFYAFDLAERFFNPPESTGSKIGNFHGFLQLVPGRTPRVHADILIRIGPSVL